MRFVSGTAMLLALFIVAAPARTTARGAPGAKLDAVTFVIRHRVFHDLRDQQTVRLNQDFILGDTEYSARVVQYVPDFQMDLEHHKIFSLSNQPNNPAFRIIVRKGRVPQDTTWAFLKNPPHFGARSYFAFQVARIDFANHAPLFPDTTARPMKHAGPAVPATTDSVRKP